MEVQARLAPPKLSTNKVLQNKGVRPPKISIQRYHDKYKPRLIRKAPKHVRQNYLIKLNKCLKPYTIDVDRLVNSCAMKYASMLKTVLVLLGHLMPQHKIFVNEISAPLRGLIM
jgi:hypothetical protein